VHGGDAWREARECDLQRGEVLDFSSSVNPLGPSLKALDAIRKSSWRVPLYPDSDSTSLKDAVARYVGNISAENLIIGNGSCELIHIFAEAFIDRGTDVLVPAPTFGEYERASKEMGGEVKHLYLAPDFELHSRDLLDRIGSKTRAVFLCNPNTPTSTLISKEAILEIVEETLRKDVLVLIDETFIEFVDEEQLFSLTDKVQKYGNIVVLRSFTKAFGLAGLRVGYGVACRDIIEVISKVKVPWNVNCLGQAAAEAALQDLEHLKRTKNLIEEEKVFLLTELSKIGCLKVFPANANFIFVDVRRSGLTSPELRRKMLERGILVRDCSSFKGLDEYYVRIAVRTRPENERLLEALRRTML
jgi:threonine-phosphate decarboxylase